MPAGWVSAGVGVLSAVSASSAQSDANDRNAQAQSGQQAIEQQQLDQSKQQWQRYLDTYAPLEDKYVAQAQDVGSIANQNKAAADVAAGNAAAYGSVREQLARSPGMNPNSQDYLQAENKINLAEAAGSATSQNDARSKVMATGNARMTDALSFGKGLPASAASTLASAGSTGSGLMAAQLMASDQQLKSDQKGTKAFTDAAGTGSIIGRAAGGLFQSKAFQGWLGGSSGGNDMSSFSGLGDNSNYGGITAASQSVPLGVGGMGD